MQSFQNGRLARRLGIYVILASSIIAIFTTAIQIYSEYKRDVQSVHDGLIQIEQTHLSNIASRIWVLDTEELKTTLNNLLELPSIRYIAAYEDEVKIMETGSVAVDNAVTRDYPLVYYRNSKPINIGNLVVKASLDEAYQHAIDQTIVILASNAIKTFLVAAFILFIFYKLVAQHLQKITNFAGQLDIKNLDHTFEFDRKKNPPDRQDELDLLKLSLYKMQQNLLAATQDLTDSQTQVNLLLNSTAEAIYGINTDGDCTFINRACIEMLGYKDGSEILGRNMHDLIHHSYSNGKLYPIEKCPIFQTVKQQIKTNIDNEVIWRKDGTSFHAEYWAHPIFEEGECIGAVVTFIEITDRIESLNTLQEREQNLAITLNSIGDAVITTDATGHITRMNAVAEQLTGWTIQEAEGLPVKDVFTIINATTREPISNPIEKVVSSGETVFLCNHTTLIAKDGSEYQISDSAAPIRCGDKNILGMVLVFNDITEQYRLREKSKLVHQQLQSLLNDMQTMLCILDSDGRVTFVNKTPLKTNIVADADVVGIKLWEWPCFSCNPDLQSSVELDCKLAATGKTSLRDLQLQTPNGPLWIELSLHPVLDDHGLTTQLVAESRDISQRKIMEDEIRTSTQHLRLYREQSPMATIEWDTDFQVVDWNLAAEQMFGYTIEEVKGKYFVDIMLPESAVVDAKQSWTDLMAQTGGTTSINENLTKDNRVILCQWYNTPLIDQFGKVIGAASTVLDVTTERQNQQALLYKELEQREILNSMLDAVITMDQTGIILSYNHAAESLFGYQPDEIIDKNIKQLIHQQYLDKYDSELQKYLDTGNSEFFNQGYEIQAQRKNKKCFPMRLVIAELAESTGGTRRFIASCLDLTYIKSQEAQLRHSQKMDALGKLTGGISHDYNNMLGVIMGYADLLEEALSDQPDYAHYARQIFHAGERGAKLTRKLLAFSRQKASDEEPIDINELLASEKHLLEKSLTARIKLIFNLADELWAVKLDGNDLEDAILNLCINAMHSMDSGGKLTIETTNKIIDKADAQLQNLSAGEYVLLTVTDTGCGMSEATKDKIFDPFFTTKGEQGTGLGLSQVYGFMERSNGTVKVYTELGYGTQISLYFPRYHQSGIDKRTAIIPDSRNLGGNETILVVDDESSLLELTCEILRQKGYRVHCAKRGKQALEILENNAVDLLFSDVIMPEMDGYQLAAIVQQKYPEIIIQLASGFSDERHLSMGDEKLYKNQIQKPYHARTLLKKIRDLLDD